MRETLPVARSEPSDEAPQHLCQDKGYDDQEPRDLAEAFGFTRHLRTRGEEGAGKREAGKKARRRVVERTHSWLNRFRRILIRWDKKPRNDLALLHVAGAVITGRHPPTGWPLMPAPDEPNSPGSAPAKAGRREATGPDGS